MAINMGIIAFEVFGDSKLIINQLLTEYEVRKDDLVPYFRLATQLQQEFEAVTLEHVPRKENQMAEALANLALSVTLGEDEAADVPVCQRWVTPSSPKCCWMIQMSSQYFQSTLKSGDNC
ncbi:hypothetical protein ACFX15_037484 [Malus domestica]